jgi:hypothetical protein
MATTVIDSVLSRQVFTWFLRLRRRDYDEVGEFLHDDVGGDVKGVVEEGGSLLLLGLE